MGMSISAQVLAFVTGHPGATANEIARGVDTVEDADHAAKLLFALHKRGALTREGKPFAYTIAAPRAATAPDQPEVSATTPAADEGNSTQASPASSAPRAGRAPARAMKPAAGKRVSDRIESWCVWHDGEVHFLAPDGNTWTLDPAEIDRIAGALDGMEGV
jgi:hypothetical protein